jgi:hypothetical protein
MKKTCKHDWAYEHAVYGDDAGKHFVHRQCRLCLAHQLAKCQPFRGVNPKSKGWDLPSLPDWKYQSA